MSESRTPPQGSASIEGPSDAELATEFVAGSDAAFDALYRRYATPIYDFLRWTVRDQDTAQDLTQSAFLAAYERRESLREPAAVRGWLYRIAHNLAMNHVTRTRATDELDDDAPFASASPGPAEVAESAAAQELVWDAAASLEPRQFAVLDLAVRKGLTSAEIAEVLGLDAAAASLAVHRSREALGNAVRFLLVARRRGHCERLAELVPEGVRRLTPEQRASVDRHMRRCDDCQRMGLLLTAPEEVFAAAPLAVLPLLLRHPPRPAASQPQVRSSHLAQTLRTPFGIAAVVAMGAVAATAITLAVHHGSHPKSAAARTTHPTAAPLAQPSLPPTTGAFRPVDTSTLPGGSVFSSVACPTGTTCYAVATSPAGGVVATTADAGRTWSGSVLAGTSALAAVDCVSDTACVVGGSAAGSGGAVIFTTSDGGAHWVPGTVPTSALISVLRCPDGQHCLAVGEDPRSRVPSVISSTDGGATWAAEPIPQSEGRDGYLGGARCLDAVHCWVVGDGIWFTADLGATWQDLATPAPTCAGGGLCGGPLHTLTDVDFTSPTDGWVVGGVPCGGYGVTQCPSYRAHTTDGGATWQAAPDSVANTDPYAVQVRCAASRCVVVGQTQVVSVLSETNDGGSTWQATQQVGSFVRALGCSPELQLCVLAGGAGSDGLLYTDSRS